MLILDTEIYKNYFLLSFLNTITGGVKHFELKEGGKLDSNQINKLMCNATTVGFNSNNFDLPIIYGALLGWSTKQIKTLCDDIIVNGLARYQVAKKYNINIPKHWDHIDIIEVAVGRSSLKLYGGRLHQTKMQDLPIQPDALLTDDQMKLIRDYCENDLKTTQALYEHLKPQIDLRVSMSEQYGLDLRSKSDAQIAEAVIVSELTKLTGREYRKQEVTDGESYRYKDPEIISFESKELNDIFNRILEQEFTIGGNGSIVLPKWMKEYDLQISGRRYSFGIGGLHSCEESQFVRATDDYLLIDKDVASYYPNIILQQRSSPKSMGNNFLKVYQSIVDRRLEAKKKGDKVTADVLKICVNGSYGKLGSKYSTLYAPELLIQTTITGQLALLMLIERLEGAGISVVSANTDGVVMYCHKGKESTLEHICFDWQLDTSFTLERTDYKLLASRDVNSYVAVKTDGKVKGKGLYAPPSLSKNPDFTICCEAVAMFLASGKPIEMTIRECKDIRKFVSVRKVTGGGVWQDTYLGKAVRFYKSIAISNDVNITYLRNGNQVPKSSGCRPLMDLPDDFPTDVDYEFYIERANEYLKETGWNINA